MKKLKIVSVLFVSVFLLVGSFLTVLPKQALAAGEFTVQTGGDFPENTITTFKATGYINESYLENFPASTIVEKGFKYWNTSNNIEHTTTPSEVFWKNNPPDSLHAGFYHVFTGMMCGNTYKYKAYAKNTNGVIALASNEGTVTLKDCNSNPNNPYVTTGDVGQDQTNADLHGLVENRSGLNGAGFEYGVNTTYGQTKLVNVNNIYPSGGFGARITDLICGNTYHYRAYVINSAGRWNGDDKEFTVVCFAVKPLPPIWSVSQNTGGDVIPHFVIIPPYVVPKINNTPLSPGDWIGAFYQGDDGKLKNAGASYWKGGAGGTAISIMGDHSPNAPKNGFAYGETINYKVFSYTTMKEYDVLPEDIIWDTRNDYNSGTKWYSLNLSFASSLKASTPNDFDAYAVANPSSVCVGQGKTVTVEGKVSEPPQFMGYAPGQGNIDYSWFKGSTTTPNGNNQTYLTEMIDNVSDGFSKYFLEAEDGSGSISEKHPVIFNVLTPPTVSVSASNNNICIGQYSIDLNGSVGGDYGNLTWNSSDANGTFSSSSAKSPKYYFGNTTAGPKTLTLTAEPKETGICSPSSGSIVVNVLPKATVNAGTNSAQCTTAGSSININATAIGYTPGTFIWTKVSGSGSFANNLNPSTTYIPSANDISNGSVTLKACAKSNSPCDQTPVCSTVVYNLTSGPTVSGPTTRTICQGSTVSLPFTVTNNNPGGILWTSSSANSTAPGVFSSTTTAQTVYTPGQVDIDNGTVTTTLTATSNSCSMSPVSKNTVITIKKLPIANAGPDIVSSLGTTPIDLTGSALNNNAVIWSRNGSGYFLNSYTTTTKYYPSAQDVANGSVTLTLTATALLPCTIANTDTMTITFGNNTNVKPTVSTTTFSNITKTSVSLTGNLINTGGPSSIERGFKYWKANLNQSTALTISAMGTIGSYTIDNISGLSCNTNYKYLAYATNNAGSSVNNDSGSFTTSACDTTLTEPTVTTVSSTGIGQTTVTLNGSVGSSGGGALIGKGFKYWKSGGNEMDASVPGISTGSYSANITTGLVCGTSYNYKAYASNSSYTKFGAEKTFTTTACSTSVVAPTAVTPSQNTYSATTATLKAILSNMGGATSVKTGVKYWTGAENPKTVEEIRTTLGQSLFQVVSLSCNTKYFVQAYAENTHSMVQGQIKDFTTLACVTTLEANNITADSAILRGHVMSTNTINARFSLAPSGINTTPVTISTGDFTTTIDGLSCNTDYTFIAQAQNTSSTGGYISGDQGKTFKTAICPAAAPIYVPPTVVPPAQTPTINVPTVTTIASSKSGTTVIVVYLVGKISNTNGENATERGFEYKTEGYETLTQRMTGTFTAVQFNNVTTGPIPLADLWCGKTYQYRAFAKNSAGYGHGEWKSFTTNACPTQTSRLMNSMMGNALGGMLSAKAFIATDITPIDNEVETPINQNQDKEQKAKTQGLYRMLKMEMSGSDVLELQKFLNNHGYVIATTGPGSQGNETKKFGKLMREAVMKFQSANGLKADGIVGPKMIAKVKALQ